MEILLAFLQITPHKGLCCYYRLLQCLTSSFFFQHNFKKLRNNIEKSNVFEKPRCLTVGNKRILWSQLVEAYNYDQNNTSIHIHEKLTEQHFHLDPADKMRNHLAEDVLDKRMLYLVQVNLKYILTFCKPFTNRHLFIFNSQRRGLLLLLPRQSSYMRMYKLWCLLEKDGVRANKQERQTIESHYMFPLLCFKQGCLINYLIFPKFGSSL